MGAASGVQRNPPVCTTVIPSFSSPPHLIFYILRKAGRANSCGQELICPLYICLWKLEEEKGKGRTVLFLHSCPCFQTANSLFPLLQSTISLYLLPLFPAVYSTPHSCPILFRSHPMLPKHFRPQAQTEQVKNYSWRTLRVELSCSAGGRSRTSACLNKIKEQGPGPVPLTPS